MENGQPEQQRVGLYGGSFNPPHVGHLIVADVVRDQCDLDEIWWIPSYTPPHKTDENLASAADRLEMTRRAIASNETFSLCPVEMQRKGISYTVDTVAELQKAHPKTNFSLILGSDSLVSFADWHRPDEIVRRVPVIVYKRPGTESVPVPERFAGRVSFVEAPLIAVSGTDIRHRYQRGHSVRYLLPPSVLEYMDENQIYALDLSVHRS